MTPFRESGNGSASAAEAAPLNILVVDDEANVRRTLSLALEADGHRVVGVGNARDALAENIRQSFDLAFVDLRLGVDDGLDLIPALLAASPWMKTIVITAYASIDTAVEAMRRGATDYLPKPFTPDQLRLAARKALAMRALERKVAALQEDLGQVHPEIDFSSASPAMQRVVSQASQAAGSEAIVLLCGESGTGKSALARAIHSWSRRAAKPMSIVSCSSLSAELLDSEMFGHVKGAFTGAIRDNPGRVAICEGGTLFLDEIGDLPLSLQPKLLRFLQDREYERIGDSRTRKADVRILAATNTDLEKSVRLGRFREDLFYRINVIRILVPPLRERAEDILPLAERMLAFYGRMNHRALLGFTDEARDLLREYAWPGNVRELSNAIERAIIFSRSDRIGRESFAAFDPASDPIPKIGDPVPIERIVESHIRRVLASAKSLQEAADILGIDQATLWRRRKQYGL